MKDRPHNIVDEFNGKGLHNKRTTFQLTKTKSGKYRVKRGNDTLLFISEKEKAQKSFESLKGKKSQYSSRRVETVGKR